MSMSAPPFARSAIGLPRASLTRLPTAPPAAPPSTAKSAPSAKVLSELVLFRLVSENVLLSVICPLIGSGCRMDLTRGISQFGTRFRLGRRDRHVEVLQVKKRGHVFHVLQFLNHAGHLHPELQLRFTDFIGLENPDEFVAFPLDRLGESGAAPPDTYVKAVVLRLVYAGEGRRHVELITHEARSVPPRSARRLASMREHGEEVSLRWGDRYPHRRCRLESE